MSDLESYYDYDKNSQYGTNPWAKLFRLLARDVLGMTHGRDKALAGMIPIYGYFRRTYNELQKAEDYYSRTGQDPVYSSDVSNLTPPTMSQMTSGLPLPKMARTMDQLYTADIVEDLQKMYKSKRESFEASGRTADKWRYAWDTYNERYRHR